MFYLLVLTATQSLIILVANIPSEISIILVILFALSPPGKEN